MVRNTFVYERVEFYRSSEKWWKDSLGENDGRSHSLPDLFHRCEQCYSRKEKGDADWNDAIIRTIVTRRAVDAN